MKDEILFLETNFNNVDLVSIKHLLEKNGWIICYISNKMTIYESKVDFECDDAVCEKEGETFDSAFLSCLLTIQQYYKRVVG